MGLFTKETKEEKTQKEIQKFMNKYNLDSISEKDLEIIKRIALDLHGNGLLKAGLALSFNAIDNAKICYFSALVEQNWLIIRKLDEISVKLNKKL
jgi:hypothetical protein